MLQMKLCGDLVLREHCDPVDDITPDILQNMDEMVKMMSEQNGVGLAAPQVGITKRFLVMMNPESGDPETTPGKIAKMLKEKIDKGETGINAGKGFYEY